MISPDSALYQLVETSLRTSVVVAALIVLRPWLRRIIGSQWLCFLWLLVLARLLVPCSIESPWSLGPLSRQTDSASSRSVATPDLGMLLSGNAFQVRITEVPIDAAPIERSAHETTSSARPGILLLPYVWLAGVGFGLLGLGFRLLQTRRLGKKSYPATDPRVVTVFERIDPALRRNVELRMTAELNVPTLAGVWRPQIWIPQAWLDQLSAEEMRHVLLHELGHVQRRDIHVQHLFLLAQCIHWFNPLIWLAARLAKADREMACDAWVLARVGEEQSSEYGGTLLRLVGLLRYPTETSPLMIEMAVSKRELRTRVSAIGTFRSVAVWQGLLVFCAAVAGMALVTTTAQPTVGSLSHSVASGTSNIQTVPPASPVVVEGMAQTEIETLLFGDKGQNPPPVAKESESLIEIEATLFEAPASVWQRIHPPEELMNDGSLPLRPTLSGYLNATESASFYKWLSEAAGVVKMEANRIVAKPGVRSIVTFQSNDERAKVLFVTPSLGIPSSLDEPSPTIHLEMAPEIPGQRSISTFGAVRSGDAILLKAHTVKPSAEANRGLDVIGQLWYITARFIGTPPKALPRKADVPQITISSRLFELPAEAMKELELGGMIDPGTDPVKETQPVIMTDAQVQNLMRLIQQRDDVELLAMPRVTTKTGQRAVIEIIRELRDPGTWERDPEKADSWVVTELETRNVGATLEVEPELQTDGMIALDLKPQVVEALGFVDLETDKPVPGHRPSGKRSFRERFSAWTDFPNY